MATARLDAVFQHLRRVMLVRDGAGMTDGQLLESFVTQQDEAAFEALVRRLGPMVLKVCRRVVGNHHDAEDVFQATFLILARKASSIKSKEMVANWLHGVAYRTALKARTLRVKTQVRERQLTDMAEPAAVQLGDCHDLNRLLDQELSRLAEIYRLPILLCALEGKSIKKTAQQLGWPQGTVAGRLARGRKMLAKRLARHGLAMSGGALLLENSVSACVPPSLVAATVKAAGAYAAGKAAAAGVISANVAILMEGVVKTMFLTKLKIATVVLIVTATAGIGGGVVSRSTTPAARGDQRGDQSSPQATSAHRATDSEVGPDSKAGEKPDLPKTDLDRMQGIWEVVSVESGGKADKFERTVFMVDGKRACIQTSGDGDIMGGLYLDPTSDPKTFDLAMHKETREGIYLLAGDSLRLCYELGDEPKRPKRFGAEPGSRQVLVTLKRIAGGEGFPSRRPDGSRTFPRVIERANSEPVQPPPIVKQIPLPQPIKDSAKTDHDRFPLVPIQDSETERKLKLAFGNECAEAKRRIKLYLPSNGVLLATDSLSLEPDGRVKLSPFSAVMFPKNKTEGIGPEINTVRCEHAFLTLDSPITNMAELNSCKIIGVELFGQNGISMILNGEKAEAQDNVANDIKKNTKQGLKRASAKTPLTPSYVVNPPDILLVEIGGLRKNSRLIERQSLKCPVQPDGTTFLAELGNVRVAGETLDQIRATITERLAQHADKDAKVDVQVNLIGYKTQVLYVIVRDENGEYVHGLLDTGGETVVGAILRVDEALRAMKGRVWLATAGSGENLEVDWRAITQEGRSETNYLLRPGDRVYVESPVHKGNKGDAKKIEDLLYEHVGGGYLELKDANMEIWVNEVKGRRLIRPTFIHRDRQGRSDYCAMAEEAELKVDLEKGSLQIIMSSYHAISRHGEDHVMGQKRTFTVPLPSSDEAK